MHPPRRAPWVHRPRPRHTYRPQRGTRADIGQSRTYAVARSAIPTASRTGATRLVPGRPSRPRATPQLRTRKASEAPTGLIARGGASRDMRAAESKGPIGTYGRIRGHKALEFAGT